MEQPPTRGRPPLQRGEFPPGADLAPDEISRRDFIALLGASAALASLTACGAKPAADIVPYASQPPEWTPGIPRFFATSHVRQGYATGLLAESHEGHPTKLEGNPDHPASLGASGMVDQAAIVSLYDPERMAAPRRGFDPTSWRALAAEFGPDRLGIGRGLHLLLEPDASPLVGEMLERLRVRLPRCQIHWHAATDHDASLAAAERVLGRALLPQYAFDRAEVVFALGADPLASGPFCLRYAHDWSLSRRPLAATASTRLSRWYVAEASPTCTGWSADHRIAMDERDMPRLAAAILARIAELRPASIPSSARAALHAMAVAAEAPPRWIRAVADDLVAHAGAGAVVVGEQLPPSAHALGMAIDAALGNAGAARAYRRCALLGGMRDGLGQLAEALAADAVETLVVVGGNPAHTAAGDIGFAKLMARAPRSLRVGLYEDETALRCTHAAPLAHWLESWGDARAFDGTISAVQPLIDPLHDGRTLADVVAMLIGDAPMRARDRLLASWLARGAVSDAGEFDEVLRLGLLRGSDFPSESPTLDWDALARELAPRAEHDGIHLSLRLDAKVEDGRGAGNAWLQELPEPITKLTWDNAALISPALSGALGLRTGDLVDIVAQGARMRAPVLVLPGQAGRTVTLALGYGRTAAGVCGTGVGVDGFALRTAGARWLVPITLEQVHEIHVLAVTQHHWSLEDRPIALSASLSEWRARPAIAQAHMRPEPSVRVEPERDPPQWGLAVDLSACIGCSACAVACQAENNVPTVGKAGVLKSREMHWLRIDRYYLGAQDDPSGCIAQPMMCQHCEKAPCEYVCPTYATAHSPDGLNEMTYNRCVGTRFCSNNCPYKVRRFNWFEYNDEPAPSVRLLRNPDVTVRDRGVMEKCTACVQRVREAGIRARTSMTPLKDGDVVTACQQACPTRAIVFGDTADPSSAVSIMRASTRAYGVLEETGAQPRTRYLARLHNPNPGLA